MFSKRKESGCFYGSVSRVTSFYVLFLLISFFGWVLEEVFFFLRGHGFIDRGFLSFPICIVYGLSVIGVFLLCGVPHRMRIFSFALPIPKTRRQKFSFKITRYLS